ncbi:flagellar hook-associated protein FlgL [Thalassomonas actiniarum]|uniref:Flagellar hook-associated protein FlgL n=1 Tax=Thalassomonas actiniarum TaxID=485447 RepID=A0AAE9YS73_9GAMM|nr:flagellar hook-associated protein FlgL [Thalassomonas actiniarum]WDD99314.1 flagellar hook-associated protein FlgL [Thalassomonas actiniarum]
MRVSTGQLQQLMMNGFQRGAVDFANISQQMATGKKILKPSDDALGTVQLMALKKEQANIEQFNSNISNARRQLGSAETYISSMSDTLLKLRDLTLEAGNGAYGLSERQALAAEMQSLKDALMDTANAKGSNGKYLFSGSEVETAPISGPVAGAYSYAGDNLGRQISVSSGVQVTSNFDVEKVFFNGGDFFQELDDFIDVLNTQTGSVGNDVSNMLDSLDTSITGNLKLLTEVGSRINSLDKVENTNNDIELYGQTLQLELESLDYGQASMQLTQAELALQATQQVYIKVNQLNLFDQL